MKKIVMLSLPPAHGVDVMGPLEVFGLASRMLEEESGRRGYAGRGAGSFGRACRAINGVAMSPPPRGSGHRRALATMADLRPR